MKKRLLEISVCAALVFSVIFSVTGFQAECDNLRNDVLRLHILANSDSDEDQRVKLAVRDALLSCGKKIFSGETNVNNAEDILLSEKDELIETANRVLEENGFGYKAQITLAEEYFTTRTYENYTLPAGNYKALKVVLGEGNGHNWWCVMFPPLCLPAATENTEVDLYFKGKSGDIIQSSPKYEIRFKIVEIIEEIKMRIYNN